MFPRRRVAPLIVVLAFTAAACGGTVAGAHRLDRDQGGGVPLRRYRGKRTGIHRIQHVIVIMQENRSFDSYFGTYPGADGIPMRNGVPAVCVHDPASGRCVRPYHDSAAVNIGGPHGSESAEADINRGAMNGFIHTALNGVHRACRDVFDPLCSRAAAQETDVMGYHDGRDIPNYWTYAHDFVLEDHFFESVPSWEPSRAPGDGVRVVGELLEPDERDDVPVRSHPARNRAERAARRRLRMDRPDLAPAPVRRELEVLRRARHPAGLRPRQCVLSAQAAAGDHARDLEPPSGFRHGAPGPPGGERRADDRLHAGGAGGDASGRVLGGPEREQQRAPSGVDP
jgi:hypothetical protein